MYFNTNLTFYVKMCNVDVSATVGATVFYRARSKWKIIFS